MSTTLSVLFGAMFLLCSQASAASRFYTQTNTPTNPLANMSKSECAVPHSLACDVLDLVNEVRLDQGLAELSLGSACQHLAQAHAEDMAQNNFFSHTSPYEGSFSSRVDRFGLKGRSAENIARGTRLDSKKAMELWMNSSGHRKNILNPTYSLLGVGVAIGADEIYFVQCFNSFRDGT